MYTGQKHRVRFRATLSKNELLLNGKLPYLVPPSSRQGKTFFGAPPPPILKSGNFCVPKTGVLPLRRKGGGTSLSLAEGGGGGTKTFRVVFTLQLEVLAILKAGGGGEKSFHSLKGGGGARKVLDPRFSHFVAPPPLLSL